MNFIEARRQRREIQVVCVPRAEQAEPAASRVGSAGGEGEDLGGHPLPVVPEALPKIACLLVSAFLGPLRPFEECRLYFVHVPEK